MGNKRPAVPENHLIQADMFRSLNMRISGQNAYICNYTLNLRAVW